MSKHDADCLRRRTEPKMAYVCTCGLTDEQVAEFGNPKPAANGTVDEVARLQQRLALNIETCEGWMTLALAYSAALEKIAALNMPHRDAANYARHLARTALDRNREAA